MVQGSKDNPEKGNSNLMMCLARDENIGKVATLIWRQISVKGGAWWRSTWKGMSFFRSRARGRDVKLEGRQQYDLKHIRGEIKGD